MQKFYMELEGLLKEHNLIKTRKYLEDHLEEAISSHDTAMIISVLNEMIGFLRDISEYGDASSYAHALFKIVNNNDIDKESLYVSYINIANALRANKEYQDAISLFEAAEELYDSFKLHNIRNHAALYNNWALAYEEMNQMEKAVELLKKALTIILESEDNIKMGSTYTNMAMCYLSMKDMENAESCLEKSGEVFEKNHNDFHYSGYAAAMGKYYKLKKEKEKAISYYEEAASNLLMTVGKNTYYIQILEELFDIYREMGRNPHIPGLALSEAYYESVKEDFFKTISDLKEDLTIGLFGPGSECFGCDDLISEDHDFDPGFIVLVSDDVSKENFERIKKAYDSLEKRYKRYYVMPLDKKGVHYFQEYYEHFLDGDYKEALITNGRIFYAGRYSEFLKLRKNVIKESRYQYLPKLILKTLEINQYLPYNLNRAKERQDEELYSLLKSHLRDRLVEYYYIYHQEFMPHDKLVYKKMNKESLIYQWIKEIEKDNLDIHTEVSSHLLEILHQYHVIHQLDTLYIEDYRFELLDYLKDYQERRKLINEIVKLEWESFRVLNNVGGKASCQNNPSYFKLMRESQFYTWGKELLSSYLNDLNSAVKYNYNILFIKYGFMEETVDLLHFKTIKDSLPSLSDKQKALINEVVRIQMGEKEDYDKENDSSMMRSNYSQSDNIYNASYETYLRGELSSYSENTLYLYARNLVNIISDHINVVKLTLAYTELFHTDEKI